MLIVRKRNGFTIVELLIVIVIIAILAALTLVAFNGITARAKISELKSDLTQATKQLMIDRVINGSQFPTTLAAANQGKGIQASPGDTFQYTANNTTTPSTFCLSATNGSLAYHTAQDGLTSEGVCSGHTAPDGDSGDSTTYAVGDAGPAGGIVFYDKGSVSDGWRYLEAGPSDIGGTVEWGCFGTSIAGADGTAIGTGKQNTIDIIAGCSQAGTAAKTASDYSYGSYTDWFLPSEQELIELHQHKDVVGGINAGMIYWSSSENGANWAVDVSDGYPYDSNDKTDTWLVRPIRSF